MKLNNFFIPLLAAGMLTACSDDSANVPENTGNMDGLYMTLTVSPHSMTRTSSPSTTTELGQADENKVSNLLLVMVDKNSTIVDYARVSSEDNIKEETNGDVTATGMFNRGRMVTYLQNRGNDDATKFYVICNPTEANEFSVGQNIDDFICQKDPETYYTSNKFVMSNAGDATVRLPELAKVQAGDYATPETAFDIADVTVERVAARFDYAEYISESEAVKDEANNCYYFTLAEGKDGVGALRVSIKEMALCNMGKQFYLFKRVNTTGLLTTPVTMFGAETKNNYVVDPFGAKKAALTKTSNDFDTYFNYALFGSNNLTFTKVSDIMADANKRGNENGTMEGEQYNFWRYALPSTLPSDPSTSQKNGNSTGVVFRAEITTPDASGDLKTAMTNGHDLYVFGGKMIGNYAALLQIVDKDAANAISVAFKNALTPEEAAAESATPDIQKKLVKAGFAIYTVTEENGSKHYYCDYYYWNRHNDNNNPQQMGAMEFGVVRNNIYKLAVTTIQKLGHPIVPGDDPDPVDPDDPDETSDFYMKVKVTVKPWGVRVNKIKF